MFAIDPEIRSKGIECSGKFQAFNKENRNFSKNTGNDPINMKVMQRILMLVRLSDQEDTEQHFRFLNDLEDSSKKKFQVSGMSFSNL